MDNLEEFLSLAEQLTESDQAGIPLVAVIGSYNTGKSTLINGLLKQQVSPADMLPTTAVPVYIKYGKSFSARARSNQKTLFFPTTERLSIFLQSRAAAGFDSIEICVNHPLLQKCTLVDTPGIDAGTGNAARESLPTAVKADKILYLFHQRGMDKSNEKFLQQLTREKKWQNRDISFWINCNLGKSDGTSLYYTRRALREIFGWSPELYLTNSLFSASIAGVRKYIEVNLARDLVRRLNEQHRSLDSEIPSRVQKSLRHQEDALFLDAFWEVKKDAEQILLARNIINKLPPVENTVKQLLENGQKVHLLPGNRSPVSRHDFHTSPDLLEIKNLMSGLAGKIMRDSQVRRIIPPRETGKWAGALQQEEFQVACVGGFSSGKSTFLNAIMGENLLPAENRPTTSSITRIVHGSARKAVITFHKQVVLELLKYNGSSAEICAEEVQAVQEWMERESTTGAIFEIQAETNKGVQKINPQQLIKELGRVKKMFTAGLRSGSLDKREAGEVFQPAPAFKVKSMHPVHRVHLTFAGDTGLELDLEHPRDRKKFQDITTSRDALRVKDIKVTHPAEFLKLAVFVDTPGLDSIYQKHSELVTDYLQKSDAYILFFNGKHVLNQNDSYSLLQVFTPRLQEFLSSGTNAGKELRKFFFVVNFADTLTPAEKSKVENYVRINLARSLQGNNLNPADLQIVLLSPLQALQGKNKENFNLLLAGINRTVWNYRGKEFLQEHLQQLRTRLETVLNVPSRPPQQERALTKFTLDRVLMEPFSKLQDEVNNRFDNLTDQVGRFKKKEQFLNFTRGPAAPQNRHAVTYIKDFSYFQWVNSLNRKIKVSLNGVQKQIYRDSEQLLFRTGVTVNPHCIPPRLPNFTAAAAIKKMEDIITGSKNFYGKIKAGEARKQIIALLEEERTRLLQHLELWKKETEKYQKDLIVPALAPALQHYYFRIPHPVQIHPGERQALQNYLAEIKQIEKLFQK